MMIHALYEMLSHLFYNQGRVPFQIMGSLILLYYYLATLYLQAPMWTIHTWLLSLLKKPTWQFQSKSLKCFTNAYMAIQDSVSKIGQAKTILVKLLFLYYVNCYWFYLFPFVQLLGYIMFAE